MIEMGYVFQSGYIYRFAPININPTMQIKSRCILG